MNIDYVNGSPYLPGAASLIEDLDKRVLLVLRDGRHLIGVLRSFDQYVNLVLEETFERVLLPGKCSCVITFNFLSAAFTLNCCYPFVMLFNYIYSRHYREIL